MHQKYQIQDYQNKDKLSVYRIQRKPKLGCTKPSTGLRVAHSWFSLIIVNIVNAKGCVHGHRKNFKGATRGFFQNFSGGG